MGWSGKLMSELNPNDPEQPCEGWRGRAGTGACRKGMERLGRAWQVQVQQGGRRLGRAEPGGEEGRGGGPSGAQEQRRPCLTQQQRAGGCESSCRPIPWQCVCLGWALGGSQGHEKEHELRGLRREPANHVTSSRWFCGARCPVQPGQASDLLTHPHPQSQGALKVDTEG